MPLQGATFQKLMKLSNIAELPDSIVLYDLEEKSVLFKSRAVIRILESLGGIWRLLAVLLKLLPLALCNFGYDAIARVRHLIFPKPKSNCPVVPQSWKAFIVSD